MILELCAAVIVYLPLLFVGIKLWRINANGTWPYIPPIQYNTFPSRHENCIKPTILIRERFTE